MTKDTLDTLSTNGTAYPHCTTAEGAIPAEYNSGDQLRIECTLDEDTVPCIAQCAVIEALKPRQPVDERAAGGFPRSGCTYIPAVCRALSDCSQRVMTGTLCPDSNDD